MQIHVAPKSSLLPLAGLVQIFPVAVPVPAPILAVLVSCAPALSPGGLRPAEGSTGAKWEQSPTPPFSGGRSLPGLCLVFIQVGTGIN